MSTIRLLTACVALACAAFAQEAAPPEQAKPKPKAARKTAAEPARPKLTQMQQLGKELLEVAEGEARGLTPPMRAYALWQVAIGFRPIDRAKSVELLNAAFVSTTEMEPREMVEEDGRPRGMGPEAATKRFLQQNILATLLPLDVKKVEELLPQAGKGVRLQTTRRLVDYYVRQKNFDRAMAMIEELTRELEFPYGAATKLLADLPPEREADIQNLFTQALASYRRYEHKNNQFSSDDFPGLVARFWKKVPPGVALEAIDEILKQSAAAEKESEEQAQLSISGEKGSASFGSMYEYRLFQVMPALRKLDKDRAERLLRENRELQLMADRLPDGMGSLQGEQGSGNLSMNMSVNPRGSGPQGRTVARSQEAIVGPSFEKDMTENPKQAIATALSLPSREPDGPGSPRADMLFRVAEANREQAPDWSRQALDELLKNLDEADPGVQANLLGQAAELYLRIGHNDGAQRAIRAGMKVAAKLYDEDINPDDPNKALKAFWPSTQAYAAMVSSGTKVSPQYGEELLGGIDDEEIKAVERIAYANALVGSGRSGSLVMKQTKRGTMVMQNEVGGEEGERR